MPPPTPGEARMIPVLRIHAALAAAATSLAILSLSAQSPVSIKPSPSCRQCTITVRPEVTLGTDSGDGIIEHSESRAVRDGRGRYYVIGLYGSTIKVFDPRGKYLTSIGRKGEGPGEYKGIGRVLVGPKDSLFVLDQEARRYTVLDAAYHFVRTVILPLGPETVSVRLASGDFVIALPLRTPERIGQPLHLIGADGHIIRSFGSKTGVYRPDVPYLVRRQLAVADRSYVWSSYLNQYVIELIDVATGAVTRSMSREVSWFPNWMLPVARGAQSEAPQPLIMDLNQDSNGHLWVLAAVPDPHWREAVAPRKKGDREFSVRDDQLYFDTVIEVIDVKTGTLLATRRVPDALNQFIGDGLVGTVLEDATGSPRLQVWRVTLNQP
jgi:hypothetical protein